MHCPHCGGEHLRNTPCQTSNERDRSETSQDPRRAEERPLVGLDNPFWKPEKPAAASL